MNLRDELRDLGEQSRGELNAEAAMRGAERHRVRMLAVVPAVVAVLVAAPFVLAAVNGSSTKDTPDDPTAGVSESAPLLEPTVDTWDATTVYPAGGSPVAIPDEVGQPDTVEKVPAGWVVYSAGHLGLLLPDGGFHPIGDRDGTVGYHAVSSNGDRIAWQNSMGGPIESGGLTPEGPAGVVSTPVDEDATLITWAGDHLIVDRWPDQDTREWGSVDPHREESLTWHGEVNGITGPFPDERILVTTGVPGAGATSCIAVYQVGPGTRLDEHCDRFSGVSSVSPNGLFLVDLDDFVESDDGVHTPFYSLPSGPGETIERTDQDCSPAYESVWVDNDTLVTIAEGEMWSCTLGAGETTPVPVRDDRSIAFIHGP